MERRVQLLAVVRLSGVLLDGMSGKVPGNLLLLTASQTVVDELANYVTHRHATLERQLAHLFVHRFGHSNRRGLFHSTHNLMMAHSKTKSSSGRRTKPECNLVAVPFCG